MRIINDLLKPYIAKFQALQPSTSAGKLMIVASVGLLLFSCFSLGYMIFQNWALLLSYQWQLDPWSLAASFLFYTLNLFLAALGWFLLLRDMGASGSMKEHFEIFVLSNFAKNLPGRYWHITGRMMLYRDHNVTKTTVAFASGLEIVLMLNGAIVGYLLASPWGLEGQHWGARLLLVSVLSFALIHPATINWLLRQFKRREIPHRLAYGKLLQWLAIYTAAWLSGGLMLYEWLCAMTPVPLAQAATTVAHAEVLGVIVGVVRMIQPLVVQTDALPGPPS